MGWRAGVAEKVKVTELLLLPPPTPPPPVIIELQNGQRRSLEVHPGLQDAVGHVQVRAKGGCALAEGRQLRGRVSRRGEGGGDGGGAAASMGQVKSEGSERLAARGGWK